MVDFFVSTNIITLFKSHIFTSIVKSKIENILIKFGSKLHD